MIDLVGPGGGLVGPSGVLVGPGVSYTLADLLRDPVRDTIALLEPEPSCNLSGFTSLGIDSPAYSIAFERFVAFANNGVPPGVYRRVIGVRINGRALNPRLDLTAVEDNASSFWWDEDSELLFVHAAGDVSPDSFAKVVAVVRLHFATTGLVLSRDANPDLGVPYLPFLIGEMPTTNDQLAGDLFGISSTSGGEARLANGHGWFDRVFGSDSGWNWKNHVARVRIGGRFRGVDLDDAAYEPTATLLIDDMACDDVEAAITLKPLKRVLDVVLPKTPAFETDWPHLSPDDRGKKIPIGYGRTVITPLLVDTTASYGKYLIADPMYQTLHTVHDVWAVAKSNGARVLPALDEGVDYSIDLTGCSITILNAAYPAADYRFDVDVTGKPDASGDPIETFSDIVYDLLRTFAGTAQAYDGAAFTQAAIDAPEALSVWLTTGRTLNSILCSAEADQPSLEKSVLGLLTQDVDGRWHVRIRSSIQSADGVALEQGDFAEFKPETTLESAFSATRVYWGRVGETWQVVSRSTAAVRYALNGPQSADEDEPFELHTFLTNADDASTLASRVLLMAGGVRTTVAFREQSAKLYRSKVGDIVTVSYSPAPHPSGAFVSQQMELIALKRSVAPAFEMSGVLRSMRGLGNRSFVAAPDSAPADWASCSEEERRLYGFAADANGFIVPGNPATKDIKVAA